MAISEEDRYELYVALEQAHGRRPASTMMELLPPVGWADVATKRDLDAMTAMFRAEMAALRSELRADMAELRGELRAELRGTQRTLFLQLVGLQATAAGLAVALSHLL